MSKMKANRGAMKMKTRKGAAKRFKISAKGKMMHKAASRRHLLSNRSPKRKRQARGNKSVRHCEAHLVAQVLH